jgi:hypothetical protein
VWLLLSKEALLVLAIACAAASVMAGAHLVFRLMAGEAISLKTLAGGLHAPSALLGAFGQGLLYAMVIPAQSFQAHLRQLRVLPIGSFQLQVLPLAAVLLRCIAFTGALNLSLMAAGSALLSSDVTIALIGAVALAGAIRLRWPSGVRSFGYLIPVMATAVLTTAQPAWSAPVFFIAVGFTWLAVAIVLNHDTLIRRTTTYRSPVLGVPL